MIGPVRIDYADFRYRRVAFFFIPEVGLAELQVVKAHGQAHAGREIAQILIAGTVEIRQNGYVVRLFPGQVQAGYRIKRCFPCFYRVDAVMFDSLQICCG